MPFSKAAYLTSCDSLAHFRGEYKPSLLFIGRTNVGKSTLINALVGEKIAFASKKAGKTKALNLFYVDDSFYLIDAPGYGSKGLPTRETVPFAAMMEDSLPHPMLRGIALLLDLRHAPSKEDRAFASYLLQSGKPLVVILTKADAMNQKELCAAKKWAEELGFSRCLLSDQSGASLEKIKAALLATLKK